MNDIEVLKVVANALRESADEVAAMHEPGTIGPFTATALTVTGAANRLDYVARQMDSEKDRQARKALAGLDINVPDFADHKHSASEHTGSLHHDPGSHNGYPQHTHDHRPGADHAAVEYASWQAEQRGQEAGTPGVRYTMTLGLEHDSSNGWQRLAMVLVAQLDDLTHAAIKVSDADLMGVDGLNICWSRDPATDKTVYWLEDPARQQ